MSIFRPNILLNGITDVSKDILKSLDISLLLLDVDNTLAHAKSSSPYDGVTDWLNNIKNDFKVVIVSNNFDKRVSAFAKSLGLKYVALAMKPFPFGFNKALKMFGESRKNAVIIGDQIFTDILGANLLGAKSILLEPTQIDETNGMKIKRLLEKSIREKIKKGQSKN